MPLKDLGELLRRDEFGVVGVSFFQNPPGTPYLVERATLQVKINEETKLIK